MTLTTWPAIAGQALLTAYTLHLVRRTVWPDTSAWWLLPVTLALTITTSLPWFVTQLMPDVFTALLVLVLTLLIILPERLSRNEHLFLMGFAAFMIAAHQSHVLLALVLLLTLLPARRWLGAAAPLRRAELLRAAAPLALAVIAMVSVNLLAFGQASLSPYGNVFLLARTIYDGPGIDVLRRDCPDSGWRLCAFIDRMPSTSDEFLWRTDGPVVLSGGAKQVSLEAGAIIGAALRAEPATELCAILRNTIDQLSMFDTGDGLQPWQVTVTPWIERDFPRFEATAYHAARETRGTLQVPNWMIALHATIAVTGVAGLFLALLKRQQNAGFAAAVLLALLVNAAVTGGLSMPHHRYQSRIMWLPPFVLLLSRPNTARA